MLLALIAAGAAAEITIEGTPEAFIATSGGSVLTAPQFMEAVGDEQGLRSYHSEMARARGRATASWIGGPVLSGVSSVAWVWAFQEYEPAVSAIGSAGLFGGMIWTTAGSFRYQLTVRRLADVQSWYTYTHAVAWADRAEVEAPTLAALEPVQLHVTEDWQALRDRTPIRPDQFAWAVGDGVTWRRMQTRRVATGVGGSLLLLGGMTGLAIASVSYSEEAAVVAGTAGVVGLLGGGLTLTVGRRSLHDLSHWYTREEIDALVTPHSGPS